MHPWVSVYGEAQSKHLVIFSPREPPYGDPSKAPVPESGLARAPPSACAWAEGSIQWEKQSQSMGCEFF